MKTQEQHFYQAQQRAADADKLFLDFVADGLTSTELVNLIRKRPALWGRFSPWVATLPGAPSEAACCLPEGRS
jgi:hypothetical protein